MQVEKYLGNEDLLQEMSEKAYKKALEKYEPKKLFVQLLDVIYKQLNNIKIPTRKFKNYSDDEKLIRRGEIYYYLFFRGVYGGSLLISNNDYVEFLMMSVRDFKKAVDKKSKSGRCAPKVQSPRPRRFYRTPWRDRSKRPLHRVYQRRGDLVSMQRDIDRADRS